MQIRSFKLRLDDGHVRIVPLTDAEGRPFEGPGVDLRGPSAEEAFRLAAPLLAGLGEIEPGISVRSISIDLQKPRLTATLHTEGRPRAVRIDEGPALTRLLRGTAPVMAHLIEAATRAISAREG